MKPNFVSEEEFAAMKKRVGKGGVANTHERTVGTPSKQYPELAHRNACDGKTKRGSKAGANPATSPQYRSKWEAAYASKLELEKAAGLIKAWWYEPFSLWLPGKVRYKPDFMVLRCGLPYHIDKGFASSNLEIIEVKGWSRNRRDGMTRLKIAAALFPCFTWRMVYRTEGGGWDGEYL